MYCLSKPQEMPEQRPKTFPKNAKPYKFYSGVLLGNTDRTHYMF